MHKLILSATLYLLLSITLASQTTFTAYTDQDFFYTVNTKKNEDRNYTQGTLFSLSNPDYYNSWLFSPFRLINNKLSVNGRRERQPYMSSVAIIGTAFTPRIIDSAAPIVGDRPFAFLFGISTSQVNQLVESNGGVRNYESFSITYGLLGTNLGFDFQGFAHQYIVKGRPINPKGWHTQISNGGAPTFLFNYERLRIFNVIGKHGGVDGSVNCGLSAGYYTRAYGGLYIRFGKFEHNSISNWAFFGSSLSVADKANEMVNDNIFKDKDSLNQSPDAGSDRGVRLELFGFSKTTVNFMGRNSLLLGQYWSNNPMEYTLDPSWVKVAVLDAEFGLALGLNWKNDDSEERFFRILYKNTVRSPEFDSDIFPVRWHYFGSLGVQFSIN